MEDLTKKEMKALIKVNKLEKKKEKKLKKLEKKKRRKMKSGKRALFTAFGICIVLIFFTMAMIYLGKDTTSLTILAGAGIGILPIMYGIYDHYNTKINLMHMEKNYIEDYDEENNIY